jgi:hypothetical protein
MALNSGNTDSGSSAASVIVVVRAFSKSSFAFSLQGWAISSSASRHAVSKIRGFDQQMLVNRQQVLALDHISRHFLPPMAG